MSFQFPRNLRPTREIQAWKMQAVGNDFLLVDASAGSRTENQNWPALAQRLCARRHGLGADGLLVITYRRGSSPRMRMWNPDGTEDFCGNGMRCAARYLHDRALVAGDRFSIRALGATVGVEISHRRSSSPRISLDLGPPRLRPSTIPMRLPDSAAPVLDHPIRIGGRSLRIAALSTGSTHAIIFCDRLPAEAEVKETGSALERHRLFPQRTSVMWVVVDDRRRLRIRIWERGVGETMGCGSGACAAAVAARLHGRTDRVVTVVMPGGAVQVGFDHDKSVILTGSAAYVCGVSITLPKASAAGRRM